MFHLKSIYFQLNHTIHIVNIVNLGPNDKKHNDKTESEAKRHNKEVENLLKATKAMKIGKGKQGSIVYLQKKNGKGGFFYQKGG